MKTGITGITFQKSVKFGERYFVKWRKHSTTTYTIEKAIEKMVAWKMAEIGPLMEGKSEEWKQGYIVGLIHGEFISEEESRLI